jgi:hypothetical protein
VFVAEEKAVNASVLECMHLMGERLIDLLHSAGSIVAGSSREPK